MKKQVLISSLSLAVIFALSACGSSEEPARQRPQRPPRIHDGQGPVGPDVGPGPGPGPQEIPPQQGRPGPLQAPPRGQGAGPRGQGQPGLDPSAGPNQGEPSTRTPGPSRRKGKNAGVQVDQPEQRPESVGPSKSSNEDKSAATPTEKSYRKDLANLQRTESALKGAGLQFMYLNHGSQMNLDSDLIDAYKGNIVEDAPPALKNYVALATQFSETYKGVILVDKGQDEFNKARTAMLIAIATKVKVAQGYIELCEKSQQ